MESISLFVFKIRLFFLLLFFLSRAFYALHPQVFWAFTSLCFLFLNSLFFLKNQLLSQKKPRGVDYEEIKTTQKNLEEILKKQGTHRDVLYNLYLIEKKNGNLNKAQEYLNKASSQDPNGLGNLRPVNNH